MRHERHIYIAGPMRGKPLLNFPAFDAAYKRLASLGWSPLSPVDMDRQSGIDAEKFAGLDEQTQKAYVRQCLQRDCMLVCNSDAIYMLKGWEASLGARAEHALAIALNLEIYYETAVVRDCADGSYSPCPDVGAIGEGTDAPQVFPQGAWAFGKPDYSRCN